MPDPSPKPDPLTPFIELLTVDSTNNYALQLAHAGMAQHGMAIFAHEQLTGKGQRGKSWVSEKGSSINLSIIIRPVIPLREQFLLSIAAAAGTHKWIKNLTGDYTKIKWPNDIYWQDRKAGGILIESAVRATGDDDAWHWAVIGIGINVNQASFESIPGKPVSILQITGKKHEPLELAHELHTSVLNHIAMLEGEDKKALLEYFNEHLYMSGQIVELKNDHGTFSATLLDVTAEGILRTSIGDFRHGEVEFM